ncbi:diaminopimelate epimerase [Desulfovibrio ferrophilus]|uniref:Diaminopimelate epimerase-like protein n=1 Tax=Desulfovibrio ferrophilus TaxID=241368 RepID=A0A2Z6B1X1_9BACT|nr:diaminopimelate epimerase [Desulfovibrio ferrophilus]BBD09481.1 diaminopimelate epimerase-like protein [Desulfovibrio ferrophilus]
MSSRPYRFYKLSPGGNTTILIMDAETLPVADHPALAARFMDPLHLQAEQVGFVSLNGGTPRLDMMGGEFCGNAARCLTAVLALEGHLDDVGSISVSGVEDDLDVRVSRDNGALSTAVQMPVREDGACISDLAPGIALAELDGITHLLLDEDEHSCPVDPINAAARLRAAHGLGERDAVGCIWYSGGLALPSIRPVVWVRETNTTHLETACGSGTMALTQLLACQQGGPVCVRVLQPSGQSIEARVDYDQSTGRFSDAWISGRVEVIAKGITYL